MERGEVDVLGINELIPRCGTHVFNIIDQEKVRWLMVGEEDDLGAAFGEIIGYCCADT